MFSILKREPTIFLVTRMWRFAAGHRKTVVLFWLMSAIGNLIWLLPPLVFGMFINQIQTDGISNISYLLLILGSLFVIDFLGWVFHGPSRILENIVGFRVDRNYKKYLYNGVLSLPLTWHSDHDSGDTIDKINKSTSALFEFSARTFFILKVIIRVIGTTAILVYFNVYVGVMALVILVVAFYVIFQFDMRLVPQYKEINRLENRASAKVFDGLSNITTVKVLGIQMPILGSIMKSSWNSFAVYRKNKILMEAKWFVGAMFFTGLVVVPVAFYIWYQYSNNLLIQVGTISTLYLYLQNLVEVYYTFASVYEDMIIHKARMQNVEPIEAEFNKLGRVHKKVIKDWENISINNLKFAYDSNSGKNELNNFSIDIKRGEKIALVGESGSGKSTLLKIIHGMYDSSSAQVSIDGATAFDTNFVDIDFNSTLVPQEPEVFSASIRENVTLLLDFSDEEIKRASDAAVFSEVIDGLPNKIDSVINERGVNLSGGQKQRLALTRALLFSQDKKIILLDESTSSVDSINEVKIYKNIFENFSEATIVASIHKMNLLKYFDRIIILDKGTIRNQGSFEYLLSNDSEFKKSWEEFVLSHKGEEV